MQEAGSKTIVLQIQHGFTPIKLLVVVVFFVLVSTIAFSGLAFAVSSPAEESGYIIYQDGGTIYAKNGQTGNIDYSGTDTAAVIQSAIDALTNGGSIFIKAGTYSITSEISLKDNIKICGDMLVQF